MGKQSPYAVLAGTMYPQGDALKEVKDMSKSLVSGEYEREYRNVGLVGDAARRRRSGSKIKQVAVASVLVALFLWLLALTMIHQLQISRLRKDLDLLSANLIAVSANLDSLTQKVSNNRLFDEFKHLEDTMYTDEDPDPDHISVEESGSQGPSDVEKLHGITVLESDDEDMYDDEDDEDDDAESGDWYPDYDKRRDMIGHTNMVKLKPEDFTGSVVTISSDKQGASSVIREIKRMLNENPEAPDIELAAATPVQSEAPETAQQSRGKRSTQEYPVEVPSVPKQLKPEERRKKKKFMPPSPLEMEFAPERQVAHSSGRSIRNSDDEEVGQKRPFVAAHFHGNTSHLSTDIHEFYKGNGLVRVAHGSAHDVWYPSPWTMATPQRPTLTRKGHVHVHHTGVYLVYVQIYYLDSHDVISWVLHRTNFDTDREPILQCAQSSHHPDHRDRPNSCFSASALFLKAGDRLEVRNTGGDRHSIMQQEKSFIGLIKLADAEDPEREF